MDQPRSLWLPNDAPDANQLSVPTPVFRSSCDPCASSKVKCDQVRPVCRRCILSGACCFYGISRKHGPSTIHSRHSRRKSCLKGKATAARLASSASEEAKIHVISPMQPELYTPNSDLRIGPLTLEAEINQKPLECRDQATSDFFDFNLPGATTPGFMDSLSGRSPTSVSIIDQDFGHCPPVELSVTYGDSLAPEHEGSVHSDFTIENRRPLRQASSSIAGVYSDAVYASVGGNLVTDEIEKCQGPQSCFSIASSTLQMLCEQNTQISSNVSSSRSSSSGATIRTTASSSRRPGNDNILHYNKTAIANITSLLNCPCAQDPYLAMLYASIVSKTLLWYQCAGGSSQTKLGQCSRIFLNPSASGSSSKNSEIEQSVTVTPLPITVGDFELDADDRKALSKFLLLSELRKAGLLIDHMANKFGRSGDNMSERSGSIYVMLGAWLKAELARTIRDVEVQQLETS